MVDNGMSDQDSNQNSDRDYGKESVFMLRLLMIKSLVMGTDEWQKIKRAIDAKTGSARPPKRKWY